MVVLRRGAMRSHRMLSSMILINSELRSGGGGGLEGTFHCTWAIVVSHGLNIFVSPATNLSDAFGKSQN